jgi:hypothetical protein
MNLNLESRSAQKEGRLFLEAGSASESRAAVHQGKLASRHKESLMQEKLNPGRRLGFLRKEGSMRRVSTNMIGSHQRRDWI